MRREANAKKLMFLNFAADYINLVQPSYFIPFAGTYILGGNLAELNEYRGVPTIPEALEYLGGRISDTNAVGLEMNQFDKFCLQTGKVTV